MYYILFDLYYIQPSELIYITKLISEDKTNEFISKYIFNYYIDINLLCNLNKIFIELQKKHILIKHHIIVVI